MGDRSGYVQLRRGLFDHIREGKITFMEASIYIAILVDANPSTGVCYGSAGLYSAVFGLPPRTVRDALEKLERKAYLKRFTVVGKHGSYPILINKFLCTDGAAKGRYINAYETVTCESIVFFGRDEDVELNGNESVNEDVNESAASRRIENREQKLETREETPSSTSGETDQRVWEFELVSRMFAFYVEALNRDPKRYTLTDARKQKSISRVRERLKIHAGNRGQVELDLARSIENLAASDFHREGNYIDWTQQIFRSSEEFEKRLSWKPSKNGGTNGRSSAQLREDHTKQAIADAMHGVGHDTTRPDRSDVRRNGHTEPHTIDGGRIELGDAGDVGDGIHRLSEDW